MVLPAGYPQRVVLILGDCPTGVDLHALCWCHDRVVPHERYEVRIDGGGRPSVGEYHARSQRMVDEGRPDRFIAFWDGAASEGGPCSTLDLIRRCARAGVPGRIVPPRGIG